MRIAADRVARAQSGGDSYRRLAPRPGARSGLAGRRARRQPVRPRAAADALRPVPRRPDLQRALDAWNRGYCPACGSWPAVARSRGRPSHAPLLVLLQRVGADDLRVHLLRRERREVRDRRAGRGTQGSPARGLQHVRRLSQDHRSPGALALPAAVDLRHRDDRSRRRRDGARLRAAGAERVSAPEGVRDSVHV